MILVDTGVWVDYLNGNTTEHTDALDAALAEGLVVMGDLILLEILQGFRNDKDFRQAKSKLATLEQFELFGNEIVIKCAANCRKLRKQGITIRHTPDVIIATYCIENKVALLFQDRDFNPFVEHLNLTPALS